MDPRLRAFFAPQLTSEGIFPFEKLPPKATVDRKMDSPASGAKPSQPVACKSIEPQPKPETSQNPKESHAEAASDDPGVTVTVASEIILNFIVPDEAPLPPENSGSDDLDVTVTVAKSIKPNFITSGGFGPFFGVKHHFTHQLQLFSKKTPFTWPLAQAPQPKLKRPDPFPKLLEFMRFESILSEDLRKAFASQLNLEGLIQRSTVPNAALLQWLWPMKEHIVAHWDRMEDFSRTQKLEALRIVKKAVQLKIKMEKADRIFQYLLADKKKKKIQVPLELQPIDGEDFKPSETSLIEPISGLKTIAPKEDANKIHKEAHLNHSKKSHFASELPFHQLFLNKFHDEKTPKNPLPPDDPGGGGVKSSADGPSPKESHASTVSENQPARPPPPIKIFRDMRKRRSKR